MFKSTFGPNGPARSEFGSPCQVPGCTNVPIGFYWLAGSDSQRPYCQLHATPASGSPYQMWQQVSAGRWRVQCGNVGGAIHSEWIAEVNPMLETWSLRDGNEIRMAIRMHFQTTEDTCDTAETFDGPAPAPTEGDSRAKTFIRASRQR